MAETIPSPAAAPDTYANAALPEPYRILGLRLRPFSLGHYLLMQRFGCAYLGDASQSKRDDLLLGVLICSQTHANFLAFIEQKDFQRQIRKWGRKAGLFDFPEKSSLFQSYLQASLREPDYIELQPGDSGGDWAQNLKTALMTKLNYSAAAALDLPLSQALADFYKLAEREGLIRLITAEELAAGAANAAALDELAAKETEAACPA